MSLLRISATGVAAGLVAAGGLAALPQTAEAGGAPDCSATFNYVADAAQSCVVPGVAQLNRMQSLLIRARGAGGGGGDSSYGGNAAEVMMFLMLPSGDPVDLYIPRGGHHTNSANRGEGAGGGGSSALVHKGTVLVEAGGGGGAANEADGGPAGLDPDGAGFDGASPCAGGGANKDGNGAAGVAGPIDAFECAQISGGQGYPVDGYSGVAGAGGSGGNGGNSNGLSGSVEGSGGYGYAHGGDGGVSNGVLAAGSGGGGGYGGGGGGAADGLNAPHYGQGAGGSGGSFANLTVGAIYFGISMAPQTGGAHDTNGSDGSVEFIPGPSAVTQAKAPDVTPTTATTHSLIDPNSDSAGINRAYVVYSTDPTLKTGTTEVDSEPVSLPAAKGDQALSTKLSGLKAETKYCYQIQGTRPMDRPSRAVEGVLVARGAIECFTTAAEPGPTPTPTPTPTPDNKKNQKPVGKNALPKSVKRSGTTMLAPAHAKTNAGQRLRTRVRCVPLKSATAGEVRYCSVKRSANGMVMLTTFGKPVRVIVVQTAAPNSKVRRYHKRTVYTVRG